jgi:pyruvate decarboxylase
MATDIRTSALKTPVDVAEYLFTRLHQIGVRSIHVLPGDYNLVALDYIDKAGLRWVGNANELNAGKLLVALFGNCTSKKLSVCVPWQTSTIA